VLAEWLRASFPTFVARRIAQDLAHPTAYELIDIESSSSFDAATPPPAVDEGVPDPISHHQVATSIAPGDPEKEPGGAGAT
jgi:hypothetical protein